MRFMKILAAILNRLLLGAESRKRKLSPAIFDRNGRLVGTLLEWLMNRCITRKLNAIYSTESAQLDPEFGYAQAMSIEDDSW